MPDAEESERFAVGPGTRIAIFMRPHSPVNEVEESARFTDEDVVHDRLCLAPIERCGPGWVCTRKKKHRGDHVHASRSGVIYARWASDVEIVTTQRRAAAVARMERLLRTSTNGFGCGFHERLQRMARALYREARQAIQ